MHKLMDLHLFIINLDNRPEKYKETIEELNKLSFVNYNLKIQRFPAIKSEKGWIGCALSHIEILKNAKENNYDQVIVVEDDNIFIESQIIHIEKIFDWLFSNKEKWEIYMGNQTFSDVKEVYSFKNGFVHSIGKTTNFMIYQNIVYDPIINHEKLYLREITQSSEKRQVNPIDRIIRNRLLVTRYPFITSQRDNYSDIEDKKVSYTKKIRQSEKNIRMFLSDHKTNFIKNKKILILDYNGVLTFAFKRFASTNKHYEFIFVNINDINFLDADEVNKLIKNIKPNYIINNLEISLNIFQTHFPNIELLQNNIIMNFNVLKAAHENNVTKLISLLSNSIFQDNSDRNLFKEEHIVTAQSHSSIMQYSFSKMVLLKQTEIYRKKYGRNFICVLPVDYYGPGVQDIDVSRSKVIPSLIHKYLNAEIRNEDFIWLNQCDGVTRQFIFSYDLVKLLFWALIDYKKQDPLIFSSSEEEISIKELGNQISKKIFRREINQKIGYKYAKGINRKSVSNQKLLYYLPNFKFTPLQKGLNITIGWIKENYSLLTNPVIDQNEAPHDVVVEE
jgi:GDP-L-fucose synthase